MTMPKTCHALRISALLSLALLMCLTAACEQNTAPPGVVAIVNGEQVPLHALQTLLDSRSASMGIPQSPSLSVMRKNYGVALSTLIAHILVRQELSQMGKEVSDHDFQKAIDEINEDYGPGGLDQYLEDSFLRKDDWLALMRDYLSLEIFKNQVLLPGIKISLPEIKKYYEEHKKDFELPDTARVCFLSTENREALEKVCADLKTWITDEVFPDAIVSQCLITPIEDIPPGWQADLRKLKAPACVKPRHENDEWLTIALVSRHPGGTIPLSESYAFIENILAREKQNEAFDAWLEQKIKKSKIVVSPPMIESMLYEEKDEENPLISAIIKPDKEKQADKPESGAASEKTKP